MLLKACQQKNDFGKQHATERIFDYDYEERRDKGEDKHEEEREIKRNIKCQRREYELCDRTPHRRIHRKAQQEGKIGD